MSLKTIGMLSSSDARVCLLLALFLTSYLGICDGSLTEDVNISRDENTTYPETTIPQGTIRGINMLTHYNRTIAGFLGVPYAQPPIGELRFKAPVSPDAWNGTYNASSETEPCPQFNDQNEISGNEDCLYLNVFTPQLPESENSTLLPVMVFSIGGGFKTENNSLVRYGPDLLLDKDVVLVVPNFRVGVLGYLTTGDEVAPGNYGLKDMVRVLEWVQVNIASFGGDPNSVTLFGGSSGAMSVHLLALSNLTDGLIHRYITQSGVALCSMANQPREVHANRSIQLGEYLGCPTNTSTHLVNCLRDVNVSRLIDTNSVFYIWQSTPGNVWLPTSEPDIEGALLTDTPVNLFAAGKIRDLPWISSVTRDEGLVSSIGFYEDPDLFEDFLNNIDLALPHMLSYASTVDDVSAYTTAVKSYYLNDLTANRSILLENVTELMGDAFFVYPAYNAFKQQLVLAENPLYFCSFEYRGVFSYSYFFSGGSTDYTGVVHGDELIYLYETHDSRFGPSHYEYSETDLMMVDIMVQMWTTFATNGTPTTTDSNSTTTWTPYSSLNNYLRIGNGSDPGIELKYDLFIERMKFWEGLDAETSGGFRNSMQVLSIALCLCSVSWIF